MNVGHNPTFDNIQQNREKIGLAEFTKVIRDFQILYDGKLSDFFIRKKQIDFKLFWRYIYRIIEMQNKKKLRIRSKT